LLLAGCGSSGGDDTATTSMSAAVASMSMPAATSVSMPAGTPMMPTVTKEQAEHTALATVPGGTVVSSELSQHDGKPVWHVHIRNTQGWDYDVNVDTVSGAVVPDN
jgi:uncharacterized membrane protein YkoI